MDANDDRVIAIERILGRTHTGRVIVPGKGTAASLLMQGPADNSENKAECENCKFVFYESSFARGCPNCGSMDYNQVR